MTEVGEKVRARLRRLFALLGSDNANECGNARNKINEILRKHGRNWNDLLELVQPGSSALASDPSAADGGPHLKARSPTHWSWCTTFYRNTLTCDRTNTLR